MQALSVGPRAHDETQADDNGHVAQDPQAPSSGA
jgi:hypothetical protein